MAVLYTVWAHAALLGGKPKRARACLRAAQQQAADPEAGEKYAQLRRADVVREQELLAGVSSVRRGLGKAT